MTLTAPLDAHLRALGLRNLRAVHHDLSVARLAEEAVLRGEATLSESGAVVALTGQHTGRSPNDKFVVRDATTEGEVAWGGVNRPFEGERFARLQAKMAAYLQGREVFVQDLFAGADPAHRLKVRVITRHAWHALFARNMFIRPRTEEAAGFEPDFTVLQVPEFLADPAEDGTRTETFILVDFTRRLVLIGGTSYAGEIKKSIFGILNFLLPPRGVLPMHCSANMGPDGDVAVFFGLSGTGKTTLSADGSRTLIGDDEHGWSERGIFNFEGGCYAKVVDLSATAEPEIWSASHRFGTVLENVVMDPATRRLDLRDRRHTENTRSCYPIDYIANASADGTAPLPRTIVMLTADAFGVLPPISRLTPEQAMYHFLSGYTAKVAGTEKGVTEPQATFSSCFGGVFMPRHPTVYARMLGEKMKAHGVTCWLVNTGWTGGAFGTGRRMPIAHTRALLRAALDGRLASVTHARDPAFGLSVPEACPEVPADVLSPRNTWADKQAYDTTAREVAKRFEANFGQFASHVDERVMAAAIRAAA